MKNINLKSLLLGCFLLISLVGCNKKAVSESNSYLDALNPKITEIETSKNKKLHTYELILLNSNGEKVDVDSVFLKLEMKSMNHYSKGKMKKIDKGVYEVELELPMDGIWSKQITLTSGKYERLINVKE